MTCITKEREAIAICDLAQRTIHELRVPGLESAVSAPRFSPDDTRIAYAWSSPAGSSIRIMNADGTNDHEVVRAEAGSILLGASWLSDNQSLIVRRRDDVPGGYWLRFLRLPSTGGTLQLLWSESSNAQGIAQGIDVSPDGRFVVFDRIGPAGDRDLDIVDTTTGFQQTLLPDPTNDVKPRWTPDGDAVVYQSDRGAMRGLYVLPVRNGVAAGEPRLVRDFSRGLVDMIGFAGDGTLFLKRHTHWYNAFRASIDPATGAAASPQVLDRRTITEEMPGVSVSPDGHQIAYLAGSLGDSTRAAPRVVVLRYSGQLVRELPLSGRLGRRSRVQWSPDGGRVAVLAEQDRRMRIEIFDVISGAAERAVSADGAWDLKWEPGGNAILYATAQEIRRHEMASDTVSTYYRSPTPLKTSSTFDVAPDGSLLLATMQSVRIVRPDKRVIDRYRIGVEDCFALAWLRDGSRIVVSGHQAPRRVSRLPRGHGGGRRHTDSPADRI